MDRTYITLNENWKFHYGEVPQAWYKGYDDSAWTSVTLPHDWSVHMPFEQTNSSGTGYLSGGGIIFNFVTILFSALTRMFPKPTFAP